MQILRFISRKVSYALTADNLNMRGEEGSFVCMSELCGIFVSINRNSMLSDIIKNILVVGAGSFVGGSCRYLVSLAMKSVNKGFPWATLIVNLAGCFLIGLLWGVFSKNGTEGSNWALFLTVGLCGGFTTFSTFSKEALLMLQGGNVWGFAGYLAISVIAGIALVALGYLVMR